MICFSYSPFLHIKGSMVAVNLTEARQAHEMGAMDDNDEERSLLSSDKNLSWLHETLPLADVLKPNFEKVMSGLNGLTRIEGSATLLASVTPDQVAGSAEIKERCDREIMMPIREIRENVKVRRKILTAMYDNQMKQLKSLKEMVSKLRERNDVIKDKAEVVKANAKSLADGSATVLQASIDLQPKLTQAEYDYFNELKKLDDKSRRWMDAFEQMKAQVHTLQDSFNDGTATPMFDLEGNALGQLEQLTAGTDKMISQYKSRIQDAEEKVGDLADIAGMEQAC